MFFMKEYQPNFTCWILYNMNFDFYLLLKLTRSRNFDIPAPAPAKSSGSLRLWLHNTASKTTTKTYEWPPHCREALIEAERSGRQ